MANRHLKRKKLPRKLERHIESLGFKYMWEYERWCLRCGFGTGLCKKEIDFEREVEAFENEKTIYKKQSSIHKNPERFLKDVCEGRIHPRTVLREEWREFAEGIYRSSSSKADRESLYELLLTVNKRSKFLFQTRNIGGEEYLYLNALISLNKLRHSWRRELKDWKPKSHNAEKQFSSLLNHLLVRYPVPKFMENVWFLTDKKSKRYKKWFLYLTEGGSLRRLDTPIPVTKKIAHHFMRAPDSYTISEAILWGQIHALGGDKRLVDEFVAAGVGADFKHNEFWKTVVVFFVQHPYLERRHVGPIIDYIKDRKFRIRRELVGPGQEREVDPEQPNFSMKNRRPEVLLQQVERWHNELSKAEHARMLYFRKSGITEYRHKTGKDKQNTWVIRQILSGAELIKEGRAMKHCVASYAAACVEGSCTIWAMEFVTEMGTKKHQTIEVRRNSEIVQSRGVENRYPTASEFSVLEKWATNNRLRIAYNVRPQR